MGSPTPATDRSDSELLRCAQAGDRAALRELTERWWPTILRWVTVQLRDRNLAEDAAQDVVVRVIRLHGSCDPDRDFGAWLHKVVVNCARDVRSRRGRQVDREAPLIESWVRADLDQQVDLSRAAKRALKAFDELPARQREVLDLCDRQGFKPTEAARMLGIAPGTARATLHQARRALRSRLLARRTDVLDLLRGS